MAVVFYDQTHSLIGFEEIGRSMSVVPVAYDIPDDVLARLVAGEFTRFGSVVRDSKQIIMHLKEVAPPVKELGPGAGLAPALASALRNPKLLIGLGTATVIAVGSIAIWTVATSKRRPVGPELPASVVDYNEGLAVYLDAVQNGTLSADILDRLMRALDAVGDDAVNGGIKIEFSVEQAAALVQLVVDYTGHLAGANAIQLDAQQQSTASNTSPIVDLRYWLELQKRIVQHDDQRGGSESVA